MTRRPYEGDIKNLTYQYKPTRMPTQRKWWHHPMLVGMHRNWTPHIQLVGWADNDTLPRNHSFSWLASQGNVLAFTHYQLHNHPRHKTTNGVGVPWQMHSSLVVRLNKEMMLSYWITQFCGCPKNSDWGRQPTPKCLHIISSCVWTEKRT